MTRYTPITSYLLSQVCAHPLRVAIDGVDAAGKTTLADSLAQDLKTCGRQVVRASIDGFHHPRSQRYRQGPDSPDGYFADSFNLPLLRRLLLDPAGQPPTASSIPEIVYTQAFDLRRDEAHLSAPLALSPDAILLFDGIFLQRPELSDCWDCRLFVQVSFETMLARAIQRDAAALGGPQAARERYLKRYIPAQQRYLAECQPEQHADIIIRNDDPENPIIRFRRA